jgi:hypothetical protein
MEMNETQRQKVKEWVEQGASLSDIQTRLKEEFGISLTYMDARLLVLEIGAEVKDKAEPRKAANKMPSPEDDDMDQSDDVEGGLPPDEYQQSGTGGVSVSLDKIVPAGAVVSGSVTFSDGVSGRWLIDRMGQLGLDGVPPGYNPSPEDIRGFQIQLRSLIAGRGY